MYSYLYPSYPVNHDIDVVYLFCHPCCPLVCILLKHAFCLIWNTGVSKKVPAKFGDTCSVRADGLCIGCLNQWAGRGRENSNMQEFFCTTLYTWRNDSICFYAEGGYYGQGWASALWIWTCNDMSRYVTPISKGVQWLWVSMVWLAELRAFSLFSGREGSS